MNKQATDRTVLPHPLPEALEFQYIHSWVSATATPEARLRSVVARPEVESKDMLRNSLEMVMVLSPAPLSPPRRRLLAAWRAAAAASCPVEGALTKKVAKPAAGRLAWKVRV